MLTSAENASLFVAALGLAAFVLGSARTRQVLPGVAIALDLFLAAGLLRLTADAGYGAIATTAIVLAVRLLASGALRSSHARHDESQARGAAP